VNIDGLGSVNRAAQINKRPANTDDNAMKRVRSILALLVVVLGIEGCSGRVGESDLIGRYLCNYSYGAELLVLNPSGAYTQLIDVNAPEGSLIHSGKWQYDAQRAEVILLDPIIVDDNFGSLREGFRKTESGSWTLKVSRQFHHISLHWNPDLDYAFRRL
jgi:hypothetical protein